MYRTAISRSVATILFLSSCFGFAQSKDWRQEAFPFEKKVRSAKTIALKKKEIDSLAKMLKDLSATKDSMAETDRIEINTLLALMEEFSGKLKWKSKECQAKLIDVRNRYEPTTDFDQKPKSESLKFFEKLLVAYYGCK